MVSSIDKDKYDPKQIFFIINKNFQTLKLKVLVSGAGAAWSHPFLPGVGLRTSDSGAGTVKAAGRIR